MLGESKFNILNCVPQEFLPKTLFCDSPHNSQDILHQMEELQISFPVIAKPDVGERGFMVTKVHSPADLQTYIDKFPHAFIIQEYVSLPYEAGVFYYKIPNQEKGVVSSLVIKEMLFVVGDGKKKLGELIMLNDRAVIQVKSLKNLFASEWNLVIPAGEHRELISIGNHCRGTKFINGNQLITPSFINIIEQMASRIDSFYYGRFDVRAQNLEALLNGDFKILEVNGAGAEPAHIYDPSISIWEGQKTLLNYWKLLFRISTINHKERGITYLSLTECWKEFRRFKYLKTIPGH